MGAATASAHTMPPSAMNATSAGPVSAEHTWFSSVPVDAAM